MTTVAGFDVDELAAQIVLHAVAGRPERQHNIVAIDPPIVHRPAPGDALAQLDEQRHRWGMQVVHPVRSYPYDDLADTIDINHRSSK